MKVRLTKKGKIILFVTLGLIVLGSGGFLLWRVLQEDTVAPEDSEAGGGAGACCIPGIGCVSGWVCDENRACTTCEKAYVGGGSGNACGTNSTGQPVTCRSSFYCTDPTTNKCCPTRALGTCVPESGPPSEGDCKDIKCEWPRVVMSQKNCACELCGGENKHICEGNPEKCKAPGCPSGYVDCGTSGSHENSPECKKNTSLYCWGNHPDCNNPFVVYRYCKPKLEESTNVCEGGNWEKKPTGVYPYGTKLNPITINTTDPDGLGTVTATVNGTTLPECNQNQGTTCYNKEGNDIQIYIDPGIENITPTSYSLNIEWKDGKGVAGDECIKSTTFTIQEEQEPEPYCGDGVLNEGEQCELGNPSGTKCTWEECNQNSCVCPEPENPDWSISKTGVGECLVENSQTYAKATYTITVTNTGQGEGSIDKVEDQLDQKVLESYLNEISNSGIYESGIITWDLEGEEEIFAPEEGIELTYYIQIPADSFGTYQNIATAYPLEGENFSDDESIDLDCDIPEKPEVPQTGIFDSVLSKIILGIVMIMVGINWNSIYKLNYTAKEYLSDQRAKKFERKVTKRSH